MTSTRARLRGRPVQPMADDLLDFTVAKAVQAAEMLWPVLHPGDTDAALGVARDIADWATRNDTEALADLVGTRAARMITALSGEKDLDAITKSKAAERVHLVRNTLTALRGTVLAARTDHTSKRAHRPGKDSLDAGLPAVSARTQLKRRPLRADEVLLARLLVQIDLREGADIHTLHSYLFAEIGMRTTESTKLDTDNLNDRLAPSTVIGAGVWKFGTHALKIPAYPQTVLAQTLPRMRPGTQPLTYAGANPGTRGASASVDPKITRFLARAGVSGTDITARSVSLWRVDHTLRTQNNLKKATRIHSGRVSNVLGDLHYTTDDSRLHDGLLLIRDHTNKVVAKVPAKQRQLLRDR